MERIEQFLYKKRNLIGVAMVAFSLLGAMRFLGEWEKFSTVLIGQLFFGQAFYFYMCGKTIAVGTGARLDTDCPLVVRFVVGWTFLFLYILMFFFDGY